MKKTTASLGVVLLFLMSLGTVPLSNVNYAAAQEVPALWARSYGGSSYDRANAAVVAPNGDVIVAGFTWSFGAGFLDAWVLRLDENGNVKWSKTYGGSGFDVAFAVAIAPNGDIIVAGETDSFGAGGGDVWVLRLDENGNIKWQKTYGGSDEDYAFAVSTAPNGDIILAGMSDSFGTGNGDFWVLRIDSEGNVKWSKTYGGSDFEVPYTVATVPNGDIVVAGFTWSFGAGRFDGWLLRLDENGNIKWQKTYGGSDGDSFGSVAIDSNGDIIVGGWTESLGTGNGDAWVLRLDENGNVKWQKTYGGSSYDGASAVVINKNTGDVVVAGYTEGFGAGGSDVWVLRLDSEGNVIWQKTYGGDGYDRAIAVNIALNGDIVVGGSTSSFGAGGDDFWVLRLPEDGDLPSNGIKDPEFSVGDTNAEVTITSVTPSESSATVVETSASVEVTNVVPQEASPTVKTQYYLERLVSESPNPSTSNKKSQYTYWFTLSYLWTGWFFNCHKEFPGLYENATKAGVDNETLVLARELHENATLLMLKAWRVENFKDVKEALWKYSLFKRGIPQLWMIRKAFLLERRACEILERALQAL